MDSSMPSLPIHHQLLELTQTHVHWVDDAIQPSHPLSSPLPPTFNLSQYHGFFKWVNSLHQGQSIGVSASVLPMNIQNWFPLGWTSLISFQFKGLSRVFSNPTIQNITSSVLSLLYGPTLTFIHDYWENHSLTMQTFVSKMMSMLFNTLSSFVKAFLPRNKGILVSWLQSLSTVMEDSWIYMFLVFFVIYSSKQFWVPTGLAVD